MKSNPAASKTMYCVRYPLDALDRAKEFLEAFRQLPQQPQLRWISWPRYFLLCHAVEMGLKPSWLHAAFPSKSWRRSRSAITLIG